MLIMQQDTTKIVSSHGTVAPGMIMTSTGSKDTWQNNPVEQTSSSLKHILFPFHLFWMWQQKNQWGPLKIHMDWGIVLLQAEEWYVYKCVKLMTINTQRNLVIFPFAGKLPADAELK